LRIVLAAAALLVALSAAAQEATLRMQHFAPPQAPAHALLAAPWAARLEQESGGRLRIPVFASLALGGTPEELAQQVREGEVDIVLTAAGFTPGRFPRTEVFELPFAHGAAAANTWALQDYYDRHLREEYRDYHVLLLFADDGAALHATRPIRRLEDLRGLKIRTAGRGGAAFLRAVGAVAIGSPAADLPQMLAKGLLDGCLAPFSALAGTGAEKSLAHHVAFDERIGVTVYALLMNPGRYRALPEPLRRLLDAHSRRHLAWYAGKTWSELEPAGAPGALPAIEAQRIRAAAAGEVERTLAEISRHGGFDAAALYRDAKALVEKYSK
jgi:TRAP-type C4-dicarboxylate transport system substrate-binding protein